MTQSRAGLQRVGTVRVNTVAAGATARPVLNGYMGFNSGGPARWPDRRNLALAGAAQRTSRTSGIFHEPSISDGGVSFGQ